MIRSLYTGASGVYSGQRQIDTISNNIANVNTMGYKESRTNFQDLFYANLQQNKNLDPQNRQSNLGIMIGHGVRPGSTTKNFTQGPLITTDNPFDLAIEGNGFFGINVNGQMHLTRSGNFQIDANGSLVNSEGYSVVGEFSDNLINYSNISISSTGAISGVNEQGHAQHIGNILTYNVENRGGLMEQGGNLLAVTENSGQPNPIAPKIKQGVLEGSNVDIANQFAQLIINQRIMESSAKLIHTADEMMSHANNIRR